MKNKCRFKFWFLAANIMVYSFGYTLGGSAVSHAADMKLGTVNRQKALQSVDAGKKAKAKLEKDFNAKKAQLQTEEAAIKKMSDEFKKQSLVMNDDARQKKQADVQERVMKYQELTARSQAEIQQEETELTGPILQKIDGIIEQVAKKKGLKYVFEKNPAFLPVSPPEDEITDEVVSLYNKQDKH